MKQEFKANEDFIKAQEYELKCNNHFAENDAAYKDGSQNLLDCIKEYEENGKIIEFSDWPLWKTIPDEFFDGSVDEFLSFIEKIKDKNSLEVGSGPCGLLNSMYWLKSRNIIEPLLDGYKKKQIEIYNDTWFRGDGLNCFSQPAEILIPELVGKVDGFVICRNCIDHTQDWKSIMNNIGEYSAKGSYFLFWADLYHIGSGPNGPDDGHFNITEDKDYFRNYVRDLGYEIQSEWEMPEEERKCVNLGFIAQKIK